MPYRKYFKPEQRLLIRPIPERDSEDRIETLTAFLEEGRADSCDLRLPYANRPGEEFPFSAGMKLELSGEALGLGIRITGHFDSYLAGESLRVRLDPTLEVFQRRSHPRRQVKIGLRYTRGHGTLRTFRRQWEKNVRILTASENLQKLNNFPRCEVNLSEGGMRFAIRPPVQVADLCMVLLELEPKTVPVCALAEVVWISAPADDEAHTPLEVGMRFIDILRSDQQRIAAHLAHNGTDETPSKGSEANHDNLSSA